MGESPTGGSAQRPAASETGQQPQESSRGHKKAISITTIAAIVGIATGVLTLRDKIFGTGDPPPPPPTQPNRDKIAYFNGMVGDFERSERFRGFLEAHDGDIVRLKAVFDVDPSHAELDPSSRSDPRVEVYYGCEERPPKGVAPSNVAPYWCSATQILVKGKQHPESQLGFGSGFPRLEGYFAVQILTGTAQDVTTAVVIPQTVAEARGAG